MSWVMEGGGGDASSTLQDRECGAFKWSAQHYGVQMLIILFGCFFFSKMFHLLSERLCKFSFQN